MRANLTLSIDLDAYSPDINDGTVDVSDELIRRLNTIFTKIDIVEHTPEKLIFTTHMNGDFKEIQP